MQSYRKILLFSVLALSLASCSKRVNCDSQEATINENNLVFKEITSYVKNEEDISKSNSSKEKESINNSKKELKDDSKKEVKKEIKSSPKAKTNAPSKKNNSPKNHTEEAKSTKNENQSSYSNMANNSIRTSNGIYLPIFNTMSQGAIDRARNKIANWGYNFKTINSNDGYYLALHRFPHGNKIFNANSLVFKDKNGNTKTYYKVQTSGVISYTDGTSDTEVSFYNKILNGQFGNAIAIQTCVNAKGDFRVMIFKP
jgi:lipoprotein